MTEAEKERAAVVAWLRSVSKKINTLHDGQPINQALSESIAKLVGSYAFAISRGDHLTRRP